MSASGSIGARASRPSSSRLRGGRAPSDAPRTADPPPRGAPSEDERGLALLWVIVLMVALVFAGSVLIASALPLAAESRRAARSLEALHAAEGGLALARARLARDPSFAGGSVDVGRGRSEARVEPLDGRPDARRVLSRGTVAGEDAPGATVSREVEAVLRLGAPGRLPAVESYAER